ncbi:AI-2E family transporter [Halobacteria archaeon AArc-m2/3/4]|uniref:AI-2E family transporter n=1 Tax=Natronoglomus mannanivorans TaxID=2979990 RepID=A0AAP2YUU7_9EURY|nr:AI-2E family transporter [Halobacteria archaeon AArc-xg1-1]MCU4973113.1 AI-2E family transporter [Halobacteria archaeon AArc-m2/3/4]
MDVRTAFFALTVVILGAIAALMVSPLLQYVVAAALLAFVLTPVQDRLEPVVGPRVSATLLTALAVVGVVVPLLLISIVVLQTVASFLTDLDQVALVETVRDVMIHDVGLDGEQLEAVETVLLEEAERVMATSLETFLLELVGLLDATIRMSVGVMVLIFLLYYLLVDGETFVEWVRAVAPLDEEVQEALFTEIDIVTWAVIKSHVLVALIEGVLGGIGLYLFGVSNVVFWTVIMIVVSFMPIVGVWLVWGPAVAYLFVAGDPVQAVALALYGVTVLSLVDNYLRAIFVDHDSGLHPAVVLIGVIGGIYLLGIMGLFLGPVLLAVFKAAVTVFGEAHSSAGSSSGIGGSAGQEQEQPPITDPDTVSR